MKLVGLSDAQSNQQNLKNTCGHVPGGASDVIEGFMGQVADLELAQEYVQLAANVARQLNVQLSNANLDASRSALNLRTKIWPNMEEVDGCSAYLAEQKALPMWKAMDTLINAGQGMAGLRNVARIYEISPREQAQQFSTTTSASSALNLGVAMMAAMPSAGLGASVGGNYMKQ